MQKQKYILRTRKSSSIHSQISLFAFQQENLGKLFHIIVDVHIVLLKVSRLIPSHRSVRRRMMTHPPTDQGANYIIRMSELSGMVLSAT